MPPILGISLTIAALFIPLILWLADHVLANSQFTPVQQFCLVLAVLGCIVMLAMCPVWIWHHGSKSTPRPTKKSPRSRN